MLTMAPERAGVMWRSAARRAVERAVEVRADHAVPVGVGQVDQHVERLQLAEPALQAEHLVVTMRSKRSG